MWEARWRKGTRGLLEKVPLVWVVSLLGGVGWRGFLHERVRLSESCRLHASPREKVFLLGMMDVEGVSESVVLDGTT